MLRALTVTASTLVGVTGVMLYEPPNDLSALAVTPTHTEISAPTQSSSDSAATSTPSTSPIATADASVHGDSFNVYYGGGRQSGTLKVELVLSGGVLKEIKWIEYPTGPHMRYTQRAYQISAAPLIGMSINDLKSVNVVTKSGATGTSTAFMQSLESALQKI